MSEHRKLRIFICHSSHDKPVVRELCSRINKEGWVETWLDEEKILPGQNWEIEIQRAVEKADIVIACISKSSTTKEGFVNRELRYALDIALTKPEEMIYLIPLRLEECSVPYMLKKWHWVDYFPNSETNRTYSRLLDSFKIRANGLGILLNQYVDLNPFLGVNCAICHNKLKRPDSIIYCAKCGTPYHKDCWDYIGGCGVLGCASNLYITKS